MSNASSAECVATYGAREVGIESKSSKTILRLRAIPWVRIIVDTLLVAGILLLSSNFLTVR